MTEMPRRRTSRLMTRKIGGKKFDWHGWGHSKKKASEIARNLRSMGYNVRVIPTKKSKTFTKVWDIFARKGKKW